MKARIFYGIVLWTFLVTVSLFSACSNDDYKEVDGQNPVIELTTEHIQSEIGRKITISGTITDKDGLRSIRLQNTDLHLDKTIELTQLYQETLYTYALDYSYTPLESIVKGDRFPILVTVTDLGGHTTEATVLLTLDGDFSDPVFTLAPEENLVVLMKESGATTSDLHFTVSDNKGLDYVLISIPELDNYSNKIELKGEKNYDHQQTIEFPSKPVTYHLTITAADLFGNITQTLCSIVVTDIMDFPKMYLADVAGEAELTSDLFGVPMLIEHTGKYQYTAHYYSSKAGTKVRFIPQKLSFAPVCFGMDPSDKTKLINDPVVAQPIVLPTVGYYEIKFNIWTGEYAVNTYTPTDEPVAKTITIGGKTVEMQVSLCGSGLPGVGSWDTRDPFVLTRDANNPYLFYGETDLKAATVIEFTITPKDLVHAGTSDGGWWVDPFWRFEKGDGDSGENEYNTYNGGNNMRKVTVKVAGTYRFEFDTHLLRSKFYLVK